MGLLVVDVRPQASLGGAELAQGIATLPPYLQEIVEDREPRQPISEETLKILELMFEIKVDDQEIRRVLREGQKTVVGQPMGEREYLCVSFDHQGPGRIGRPVVYGYMEKMAGEYRGMTEAFIAECLGIDQSTPNLIRPGHIDFKKVSRPSDIPAGAYLPLWHLLGTDWHGVGWGKVKQSMNMANVLAHRAWRNNIKAMVEKFDFGDGQVREIRF